MRTLLPLAALAALVPSVSWAQNARPGTFLADADAVAVAADSEVSAVLMLDGKQQLVVATSDDCATTWGDALRIDDDAGAASKVLVRDGVQIVGTYVFATWLDGRAGTNSAWFNWSSDGGTTWAGARRIDDGSQAGVGEVIGLRMVTTPGALFPNVYFLMRVVPTPGARDELRFVGNDGTAVDAFDAFVAPSPTAMQSASVTGIAMCSEGDVVHIAWEDDRLGNEEVWYQRSADRGATWQGSDLQVTALNDQSGDSDAPIRIECVGSTVAVAWEERAPLNAPAEIRAAVSVDGGATFGLEQRVGGYDASVEATTPDLVVFENGNVSVLWQDARNGTTSIYGSTSTDSGVTWSADALLSPSGGTAVQACAAGAVGTACWVSGADKAQSTYSLDSGLTWKTMLVSSTTQPVTATACALNPFAGNFGTSPNIVQAWVRADTVGSDGVVGGYAACGPATITNRNAGSNPQSYTAQPVILGETLEATVDLSTTGHPMAILAAYEEPLNVTLPSGYVLLVNVASVRGEILNSPAMAGPTASFSFPVPNDPCICEFDFFSQAVHFGGGMPFALSNAQDGVIMAF